MSWFEHHKLSESLAAEAELAARSGDITQARHLYANAASAEEQALSDIASDKVRTLGISAVSAVSLYYKAAQLESAERVACKWLAVATLPAFAAEQLRELLGTLWSEQVRRRASVGFAPGQVLISVKGGEIVEGGAPLDLIVEKVQTVQALFYRTVEYLRGLPHRSRGGPSREIVNSCRPWLFQTAPGSYQFAVAVQEPSQRELFNTDSPSPADVTSRFMHILRAGVEAPTTELPNLVTSAEYRTTFLKLTRNLAPTGKTFGRLEVRSATEARPISLLPATRATVAEVIRSSRGNVPSLPGAPIDVKGILRAVHLEKDWIVVADGDTQIHIDGLADTVDDVIGPMVNHLVVVHALRSPGGRLKFRDIELDE